MKSCLSFKKIIIFGCVISFCFQACHYSQNNNPDSTLNPEDFTTVDMEIDDDINSILNMFDSPKYTVLKESDSIMFAEISKLVVKDNRIYVLDTWEAGTAVSFDNNGNPIARYGHLGQGPGEYVKPYDLWIKDSIVYILDTNQKKIIRYDLDGSFISETSIPFYADAFAVKNDNGFMFSLSPDGEGGPRVCLTDSMGGSREFIINSSSGYFGGLVTPNIFRESSHGISYYEAPLDTMHFIAKSGNISSGFVFDFEDKAVPVSAKLDFLSSREQKELNNKRWLADQPIILPRGFMYATISEDDIQYNCLIDVNKNKLYGKQFASEGIPFLLSEFLTNDEEGNLIGFTIPEFIEKFDEKFQPNDSIMNSLQDNPHLIVTYPIRKKS